MEKDGKDGARTGCNIGESAVKKGFPEVLANKWMRIVSSESHLGGTILNKAELVTEVAERASMTKKDAERAVNAVVESIESALTKGERVSLVGFGTFEVRERAARVGRNPRTGATLNISSSRVPAFKAGKALKESVGK